MKKLFCLFAVLCCFVPLAAAHAIDIEDGETLYFDFGDTPEYGWIQVDAGCKYDKKRGYGYSMVSFNKNTDAPGSGALSDAVALSYLDKDRTSFDVDVPNGLYEVSVYTGNVNYLTVETEGVPSIINLMYPCTEGRCEIPVEDGQLNISLEQGASGISLEVSAVSVKRIGGLDERKHRIFVCGDSTAATYYPLFMSQPFETGYRGGWGQMLEVFTDNMYVHNLSSVGQSAKGFMTGRNYEAIEKFGREGDYVFISYGINDFNAGSSEDYREYMTSLIDLAKRNKLIPVMISETPYSGDYSDRSYAALAKEIAAESGVQYIDMNKIYSDFLKRAKNPEDLYWTTWSGAKDTIHPNRTGAGHFARLLAEECARLKMAGFEGKSYDYGIAAGTDVRVFCEDGRLLLENMSADDLTAFIAVTSYSGGRLTASSVYPIELKAYDVLTHGGLSEYRLPDLSGDVRVKLLCRGISLNIPLSTGKSVK